MTDTIHRLLPADLDATWADLAEVLHATVHDGAAVSFVWPFSLDDSRDFWATKVFPAVRTGGCRLFAATVDGRVVGTVQLQIDLPPNQPHRGEVSKLLVHPEFRHRGLARALMQALEDDAADLGKSLITLDTRSDSDAAPLYRAIGYHVTGEVPHFALNADGSGYHSTTYMHKLI